MNLGFWLDCWQHDNIPFHQQKVEPLLEKYFACSEKLFAKDKKVFVPFCGKSLDMLWFADKGYEVIGNEVSAIACESFFQEHKAKLGPVQKESSAKFIRYFAKNISIYCGDFYNMEDSYLADVGFVYDRAALIALPLTERQKYASHFLNILPKQILMLVILLTYDQTKAKGPAFSVTFEELAALYPGFKISSLESSDRSLPIDAKTADGTPHLQAGLLRTQSIHLLNRLE